MRKFPKLNLLLFKTKEKRKEIKPKPWVASQEALVSRPELDLMLLCSWWLEMNVLRVACVSLRAARNVSRGYFIPDCVPTLLQQILELIPHIHLKDVLLEIGVLHRLLNLKLYLFSPDIHGERAFIRVEYGTGCPKEGTS